jgi:hypothetical protein
LKSIALALDDLLIEVTFVGGCTTALLVDASAFFGVHHGSLVKVDLLLQNRNNQLSGYQGNISSIDSHVVEKYTPSSLETLLSRD